MSSGPVQPLRIQKGTPTSSPSKVGAIQSHRPLSEVSPIGIRRNSPSYIQTGKGSLFQNETSPLDSSPFNPNPTASPRLFWKGRDSGSPARFSSENQNPFGGRDGSVPPSKRSSIENLKRASRVKNSAIFAKEQKNEYDPSNVTLLNRPLASGRPLSTQAQGNALGGRGLEGMRNSQSPEKVIEELTKTVSLDSSVSSNDFAPRSPSKDQPSPVKSSMSKRISNNARNTGFDPENGIWSDDDADKTQRQLPGGRVLRRHAKSVTFDQAPPQVNEYEMTTPDPSSVASSVREGSYDSMEDEEEESFERGSSFEPEDSFDASLEDTDKTPVVLPEDWQFMTPQRAADRHELAHHEDPFDKTYGSPEPTAQPGTMEFRPHQTSVNSIDSNGQPRPLPPLPPMSSPHAPESPSNHPLSETMERVSSARRMLPSPPPPTTISKNDIRRMSGSSMLLEDRLRLMMMADQEKQKSEQRERRMRRGGSKDQSPPHEDHITTGHNGFLSYEDSIEIDEDTSPPRISRESILSRIRSQQNLHQENTFEDSDIPSSSPERPLPSDPDIPIPSREFEHDVTIETTIEQKVTIKSEPLDDDQETDLASIPEYYRTQLNGDVYDNDDDDASQYSRPSAEEPVPSFIRPDMATEEGQDTPRASSPIRSEPEKQAAGGENIDLPAFGNLNLGDTFNLGLNSYMTPSPPPQTILKQAKPEVESYFLEGQYKAPGEEETLPIEEPYQRPATPVLLTQGHPISSEEIISDPGTPDSVIRHSVTADPVVPDSPKIPEKSATVKASGNNRLKTRPSLTPGDTNSIAQSRRIVSGGQQFEDRPMSEGGLQSQSSQNSSITRSIPEVRKSSLMQLDLPRNDDDDGGLGNLGLDKEFDRVMENQKVEFELSLDDLYPPFKNDGNSFAEQSKSYARFHSASRQKERHLQEDTRALPGAEFIPGQGFTPTPNLNTAVANRSPLRQRGYLMRQNTKVVVASNRQDDTKDNGPPSPGTLPSAAQAPTPCSRKPSQQTWTTEPWNGRVRRKSIKVAGGSPRKKPVDAGPVPPLPGQTSNVQETQLDSVHEDEVAEQNEELEDGAERGRLFVKVVGVKDLDLPLPRNERCQFALTLDNGLHCVTTAWLELGRNAPIGQEFELVVLNDLEFQLTLQMKLEEPKPQSRPQSPIKAAASPTKKYSTWGKVFGSPRKRKELEAKLAMEAQQANNKSPTKAQQPSAYDMVQGTVARDGSFARAYVALSEHEQRCFGRPYVVDITAFNEWAMEEVAVFGGNSGRGSGRSCKTAAAPAMQRRPPYKIGRLELQLLYVPKPKGARDEEMPKSMAGAVRELGRAEEMLKSRHEGHLSQQGGDCPYWRRRFFSLEGTRLTAYHEATLQPRATINLAKAAKLIDDKTSLTQKETSTKGGGRRKSAFSEEEEGYMFVEEGFRIRFGNGEVIDFYADNRDNKEEWMKALTAVVGKSAGSSSSSQAGGSSGGGSGKINGWTEIVLKREGSLKEREKRCSPAKKQRVLSGEKKNPAVATPRAGSGGSAKTGPDFNFGNGVGIGIGNGVVAPPMSPPRKSSKDRATQLQTHNTTKEGLSLPLQSPTSTSMDPPPSAPAPALPEKSPRQKAMQIPQALRPGMGHGRTESYQGQGGAGGGGVTGKRTGLESLSPGKNKHQKTKSMVIDGAGYW